MRHRQWLSYNERRLQLRKRWEEFFAQWDAALLPVMPCPAIVHDHSEPQASRIATVGREPRPYWNLITWMAPAGACYLQATVIPVGRLANRLPVGVQIVGPYLEDHTTLDLAKRLLAFWSAAVRDLLASDPKFPCGAELWLYNSATANEPLAIVGPTTRAAHPHSLPDEFRTRPEPAGPSRKHEGLKTKFCETNPF
jgi:hypothetical protein